MLEDMIVSGAWWDHVDALAQVVGELLRAHPKEIRPVMRCVEHRYQSVEAPRLDRPARSTFRRDTDLRLLYANIEPNLADRDLFIRKAIGWVLRAFAWTDPKEVARYVRTHEAELSGLSRREALKNIG